MFRGLKYSSVVTGMAWSLGAILACAVLAAMAGWYGLSQTRQQVRQIQDQTLPALKAVMSVMTEARQQRLLELQLIAQRSEDPRRAQEEELLQSRKAVERALQGYQPLDALDRTHSDQVLRSTLSYWAAQDQVLTASRRALEGSEAVDSAVLLSQGLSQQSYAALSRELDAWRLHGDQVAQARDQAGLGEDGHLGQLIALALLATLVAGGTAMVKFYHSIIPPVHQALAAIRKLSDGENFRVKIRRADEFGKLLDAIEELREVMVPMNAREDDEDLQVMEVSAPLSLSATPTGVGATPRPGTDGGGTRSPERTRPQSSLPLGAATSTVS